ncbi:MAG: ATP-binding protein [Acidobacteriota bacterium]|nr:ATP-binding protein [Acidobacteriota bacterium]
MTNRIFFKLFFAFALVIAVATLTLDIAITHAWRVSLREQIQSSLQQETALLAQRIAAVPLTPENVSPIVLSVSQASGARATVIDNTGQVLADSGANVETMENHARRPEFQEALAGRTGVDTRNSHTLGVDFLYLAQPVRGGAVRLAVPLSAIAEAGFKVRRSLIYASALAFVIALLVAIWASRGASARLEKILDFAAKISAGDYSARLAEFHQDELGKVGMALDATARKLQASFEELEASRRELEAVLNGMQEAVVAITPDGRAQWANRRMELLTPTGVRLGQPVVQTVRDPSFLSAVQDAARNHQPTTARVTSFVSGRIFSATVAPMPSGGSVAVLHDLTDAEKIETTRRDFIANVSHELRTPLTSIQGYAETLLEGVNSEETQRDFLEIIRKNASRMTRLTEDLLILARVESGDKKLNRRPVSPAELLRDASDYFRDHRAESGMTLDVVNEALKLVSADRDVVFQVFSNFIDNACKYAASGGRILIGAHDVEGFVEFYVRDFGPGIASEHLPRLFERFYRVDKARSRESGGTGLGLAIAKHIILAHGGTISAESELNHGSTFVFTLPEARSGEEE